jgi:hypothetical protein
MDARLALYSLRRYVSLKCVELFGSTAMSNKYLVLSGSCLSRCSVISTKAPSSLQTRRFDKSTSSHSKMAMDDIILLTSSRLKDATRKLVEMFPNGLDDYVEK